MLGILFKKMRSLLFIILLFTLLIFIGLPRLNFGAEFQTQRFSDIDNTFWAKEEVTRLAEEGIITGYPDLQFRPNINITRGQAANLLANALNMPETPYQPVFKDVTPKSAYLLGAMAMYQENIFTGNPDGTFGAGDLLTREQMASVIVRAFDLQDTGAAAIFKDDRAISVSHKDNVKILQQHGITTGKADGSFDPKSPVTRGTFAVFIHRAMIQSGALAERKAVTFHETETIGEFDFISDTEQFLVLPLADDRKTYLRSDQPLQLLTKQTQSYPHATDQIYKYGVGRLESVMLTVTKRELPNGDYFVFAELRNPQAVPVRADLIQIEEGVTSSTLESFDKYPMKKETDETFGADLTTVPAGMLETAAEEGMSQEMIGKSYRSRELEMKYAQGASSHTRELLDEKDVYSSILLGTTRVSVVELASQGRDIIDQWTLSSPNKLFSTNERRDAWMHESVMNYKKRNNWYTAAGAFNKMAVTIEPMPASGNGYGRNLLLMKEDRVMLLYNETKERYYEDLLHNSFTNLAKFRGNNTFWETEVTSTYLKDLYDITAPFVDTRFNEQIALFLYKGGKAFGHSDYNEGLRNYADLLVQQKEQGNVTAVSSDAYYIPDYFPAEQKVRTHTSMNHLLGGMNILLLAYQEFGEPVYLETASAIEQAIQLEEKAWIRDDGDIWYKRAPDGEFAGRDYTHLTLEDLIYSYENWLAADKTKSAVFERMIRSKAGYMNENRKGYTVKIKEGLERIHMSGLLPAGIEHTDAL
ncbi:S-layer homology domain-containing protein [Sporosarcina cascadiensis]|uniref:S-layer homology domain-containing protein n=1 Tax=Sporosarcina cascadiensis TaxID=2660747 RepID=UPI00129AE8AB|nr:S-layer homology domain-containing protein [Sporosarcina cascadiensis]